MSSKEYIAGKVLGKELTEHQNEKINRKTNQYAPEQAHWNASNVTQVQALTRLSYKIKLFKLKLKLNSEWTPSKKEKIHNIHKLLESPFFLYKLGSFVGRAYPTIKKLTAAKVKEIKSGNCLKRMARGNSKIKVNLEPNLATSSQLGKEETGEKGKQKPSRRMSTTQREENCKQKRRPSRRISTTHKQREDKSKNFSFFKKTLTKEFQLKTNKSCVSKKQLIEICNNLKAET